MRAAGARVGVDEVLRALAAHPDYEPLTRGMQAALPHVDVFLAGNSLASLEELAAQMERGFG
jgi:uncharacterized protein